MYLFPPCQKWGILSCSSLFSENLPSASRRLECHNVIDEWLVSLTLHALTVPCTLGQTGHLKAHKWSRAMGPFYKWGSWSLERLSNLPKNMCLWQSWDPKPHLLKVGSRVLSQDPLLFLLSSSYTGCGEFSCQFPLGRCLGSFIAANLATGPVLAPELPQLQG